MTWASEFEGKNVLITGGGSGLGRSAAIAFAKLGARVAVADLNYEASKEVASEIGSKHLAVSLEVTEEADVIDACAKVIEEFGQIDIAINSAGIPDTLSPTIDQDLEDFRRVVDVHLSGTYIVSKTVAKGMIEQGGGAIINLNSMAGILGLTTRNAYSAAKAGIGMMTRTMACEWAASKVRVNAIAPGYILTPLFQQLMDEDKLDGSKICRRTPMGCFGDPDDIAQAMVFLASERAKFITGVSLPVDGGYSSFGLACDAYTGELSLDN